MTDKARNDARLPEAAEALLESWPAPERGALDWEQSADLTMARIKMAPKGSTDDALLLAPLAREADEPEELVTEEALAEEWEELLSTPANEPVTAAGDTLPAEEPVVEAASDAAPAEEPNLAAIARSVLTDRDRDREHTDIAREALSVVKRARTSSPPRAPEKQARTASPAPQKPRRATPAPQRAEAPPSPPPAGRRGTVIAGVVGAATALAAAAAVALFVSRQNAEFSAIPEGTTTPAAAVQHEKRAEETQKPVEKPAVEEPAVVALDQLKTEAEAQEQSKAKGAQAPAALAAPKESAPTAKRARTAAAPPPAPAAASVALAEEAEPSAPAAEESAPGDSQLQPAELRPALPERPSAGAVSAAVASVMNQARLCVAGQTEGSKAALTFGSDGRVSGVSVTGPAAGTPAEACIRATLSKARVAPFAKPSFAASVTVRPP